MTPMFANLRRKLTTFAHPGDLHVVRSAGRVWYLAPAGVDQFRTEGPDLEGWISRGKVTVIKANPARTVYRVEMPGGAVFVKHCRITGPRSWGREVIRPPKARLEFENARALRERGVSAVEPLAWGAPDSRWPGESFLITRELSSAVPFLHYLEQILLRLPACEQRPARRQVARAFAEFLARLHDAGVAHPDPHPGNLLVELADAHVPHFSLIDLHAVRIGEPLSWHDSIDNLVLFNRWFQLRATRADRVRFWRSYRLARVSLPVPSAQELRAGAAEVEIKTHASNFRFWVRRESRCLGSNRYFRRVRQGRFRGCAVRDMPAVFLRSLMANPNAVIALPDARVLKDSRSSTVVALTMPTEQGPVPVVLKRVNLRSRIEPVKNMLRRSQVLRSWVNGHALRDRCLPTPRPLAVFHCYRQGLPAEGYLLTEMVPEPTPLDRAKPEAAHKLARIIRAMHDRRVSHRDLKSANVILARGSDPVLIDLVGVDTRARVTDALRARELARINVSFLGSRTVTRSTRLRFLRTYLAAGPGLGADWKSWWKLVLRATCAKVAKNRRNGRTLG